VDVTFFGLLTVGLGLATLTASPAVAIYFFMFFSIANAAGTFSVGGASIPPVNLFAFFFCLRAANLPGGISLSFDSLNPRRPGFLLACLMILGVLSAVFYPRIFQGVTYIFYPDRDVDVRAALQARPLVSGSGNVTQSLYALEGLAIFAVTHAYARYVSLETFLRAFRFLALLIIGFAVVDVITDTLGVSFLMDPVRSGGYTIHASQMVSGIRRIIGSFPEPSAFASFSFQMFVGAFVLWQFRFGGRLTFFAMMGNLLAMIISTSTTGYAAFVLFLLMVIVWLLYTLFTQGWTRMPQLAVFGLGCGLLIIAALYAFDAVPTSVSDVLSATMNKSDSRSGIERAAMNTQAWSNFVDTYGIGAGLGSARASSFLFVILSNVGVFGAFLFFTFVAKVLLAPPEHTHVQRLTSLTAKSQMVGTLICAGLAGGVFDLGSQFYFWCGVASALACARLPRPVFA